MLKLNIAIKKNEISKEFLSYVKQKALLWTDNRKRRKIRDQGLAIISYGATCYNQLEVGVIYFLSRRENSFYKLEYKNSYY